MSTLQIQIASEALVLIGEAPIASFDEGGAAAEACKARYSSIRNLLLAERRWSWSRQFVRLSRLAEAPPVPTGYSAAYQLPTPCFYLVQPWIGDMAADDWLLLPGAVALEASEDQDVYLEFHGLADESRFPPEFREALVYRLAADLATTLAEDPRKAQLLAETAARELAKARHKNSVEKPAQGLPLGRYVRARAV